MVAVGAAQVGAVVTDAVGAAGAEGTGFTVSAVAVDVQPAAFLTVTL